MPSTLAELKMGFQNAFLWITLCKTLEIIVRKSLIDRQLGGF